MVTSSRQIRWAMEVANRLGTTSVWLWRTDGRSLREPKLTLRGPRVVELQEEDDMPLQLQFPIDVEADHTMKQDQQAVTVVIFRHLGVQQTSRMTTKDKPILEFYGCSQWKQIKPDRVTCRRCGIELASGWGECAYQALPSEGWEDFVEHWICHEPEDDHRGFFDSSHGKSSARSWKRKARPNEIFVGDDYLEWNIGDGVDRGWRIRDTQAKPKSRNGEDWRVIECKNCMEVVGCTTGNTDDGEGAVQIKKWAIHPDCFEVMDWAQILVEEMLRAIDVIGVHRFLIKKVGEETQAVLGVSAFLNMCGVESATPSEVLIH